MKRLFAAIKVKASDELLDLYQQLQSDLRHERIRWVNPDKLHLTLQFFGETHEELIPQMVHLMNEVAIDTKPFNIALENTGIFGSSYRPRVIWLGIEPKESITHLSKGLHSTMESIGFKRDRQNYVPHLTVGRMNKLNHKKVFNETIGKFRDKHYQIVAADHMLLYESILLPKGPVYEIIETFPFLKL